MRVLNSLVDPRIGGPQLRALEVAIELREIGVQTVFLLPNGTGDFAELARDNGFDVCRPGFQQLNPISDIKGNSKYILDFIPGTKRIGRIIREENIDIVHASMTLNFQSAIASSKTDVPLAWFFNDTGTPWPLNRLAGRAAQLLADDISVAADAVHEHFFNESVDSRTIYPPVDISKFDPNSLESDNTEAIEIVDTESDTITIGTVGNINPVKGHKYLLQSLPYLLNEFSNIEVHIAGSVLDSRKPYYGELLSLRNNLGLDGIVEFIGYTTDIPQFLNSLDMFVFPSVKEACPIAILEAMAMELPIVATKVGGIPEEIIDGEHGWLVPPRDPVSFSEAMSEVLRKPNEAKNRSEAARKRVKSKFSLNRCVKRHKNMYADLLY
ncbi:glycosyltransferase family 4 protein [Natronomonas salina]|uniref:glycosyltransferase family 4 protein n=1 Tax=Natronomonas salina TaxID=1710540 RepID=UPI0015B5658F|nr:glycosyltransferase family 4 protein [Natronomonas salina]QLD88769.1 glycosyltransferase family 4 protein [Natronomonas salina]